MQPAANRTAVLLDPHPVWLEAVEAILDSTGVVVTGKATTPEDALALVTELRPDLVVAETHTSGGGMSGPAFVRSARSRVGELRIIVLGESGDPAEIDAALDAGAAAYIVKSAFPEDVAATVRQTFDHSIFLPPAQSEAGSASSGEAAEDEAIALTPREREILRLVAEGHSNRALGRMLWVTEQTVKFHLSNIYRKLGVSNRTEAARWAHRRNLLEIESVADDLSE